MTFLSSPNNFKPNANRLTEYRIKLVLNYVTHCYLEMVKEGKKYDFSSRGKLQKEDFLRNGLVDDYLNKKTYLDYYKSSISDNPNVHIYFQKEENQVYKLNEQLADDFIDISIKETKLSDILSGETDDPIRFAIECKRINTSSDYNEYIKDIQKFVDRPFTTYRLPYEGQIAFIESKSLNHTIVSAEVNNGLKTTSTINTSQYLNTSKFHKHFEGSYSSVHKRNYAKKTDFSIFHLFFDYSQII